MGELGRWGQRLAPAVEPLAMGNNELIVTAPSGGPQPFELIFDVTRVGTMVDQTGYQYDLLGNLSRQTDAMNRDTVYEYDGLGRLTYVDGPVIGDASAFTYDGNDNLIEMVDAAAGVTLYDYDELDRLTEITLPGGLGTIHYDYDGAGRVTSITYPDATVVTYDFDAAGRLQTVTDGGDVTAYTYNAAGQIETMTQPNGVVATYGYDEYGRLVDLGVCQGGHHGHRLPLCPGCQRQPHADRRHPAQRHRQLRIRLRCPESPGRGDLS